MLRVIVIVVLCCVLLCFCVIEVLCHSFHLTDGQVQEYVDLTDGFENCEETREPFVYAKLPIPLYNKGVHSSDQSRRLHLFIIYGRIL